MTVRVDTTYSKLYSDRPRSVWRRLLTKPVLIVACLVATLMPMMGLVQTSNPLSDVDPRDRKVLIERARHCYRMPDGTIWDGWGESQYREAINKCLVRLTIKRQTGMEFVKMGERWELRDQLRARAWGVTINRPGGGGAADSPPLWFNPSVPEERRQFTYIDQAHPDVWTRESGAAYTGVKREWGKGYFDIEAFPLARGISHGTVLIDAPTRIKDGVLRGEVFLWADSSLKHPDPHAEPRAMVYRVIDAGAARLSPPELLTAIEAGQMQLYDWRYSQAKSGDDVLWSRSEVSIRRKATPPPTP